MRRVRVCVGCEVPFVPTQANQFYHDKKCAKARWRDKERPRVKRPDPHPTAVQEYFRVIRGAMPKEAVGYRLYCRELNVVLPIPASRRRDGTRPASANFTLDPIELPLLPLDTTYILIWVYPGESALPHEPHQTITPGWKDDVSQKKVLSYLLRNMANITGKSMREADRLRAEQQNAGLADYFKVSASPPPPVRKKEPRSLPPHKQGNSDDDESSAD